MTKWTIGKRIAGGFTAVLVTMLVVSAFSLWSLRSINGMSKEVTQECLPGVYLTGHMEATVTLAEMLVIKHILATNDVVMQNVERQLDESKEEVSVTLSNFTATATHEEDKAVIGGDCPGAPRISALTSGGAGVKPGREEGAGGPARVWGT